MARQVVKTQPGVELQEQQAPDARHLRNALARFATGVTVITTRTPEGKVEGLTVNSFTALSLDPPLVLWSIRRESAALPSFQKSGTFGVSVLAADQRHLALQFASPSQDRFNGTATEPSTHGCPLIEGSIAHFECRTEQIIPGGDHLIFIGRVEHSTYHEGEPLIFNCGRYCLPAQTGA